MVTSRFFSSGKKHIFIICVILNLFQNFSGTAQNLVPNPSFENIDTCYFPGANCSGGVNNGKVLLWDAPSGGSSDLYTSCSSAPYCDVPTNIGGYQNAHTFNNYVGVIMMQTFGSGREYIQTQLIDTLIANHKYCVMFYVSLSDVEALATNNIGMYFSDTHTGIISTNLFFYTPQILDTTTITDTTNWTLVSGEYNATGGEQFIIIGNFTPNGNNTIIQVNNSTESYYYIDDVSIVDCTGSGIGINELDNPYKIKLYPNPNNGNMNLIYTLNKSSKGEFDLFDITGTLIKKYPLQIGEKNQLIISETELNNGIYLYKVIVDDAIKSSNKIVIIK